MPRTIGFSLAIVFLLMAFFKAWKDQKVAVGQRDSQIVALESRLNVLSKPLFEMELGTYVSSEIAKTRNDAPGRHLAAVFIPLTIFNRGAPSVATGWNMKVVAGEKVFNGNVFQPNSTFSFGRNGNAYTFQPSESLFRVMSTPIVTGGQASGYVMFTFPLDALVPLRTNGTTVTLTVADITHHLWTGVIKATGVDNGGVLIGPPTLGVGSPK